MVSQNPESFGLVSEYQDQLIEMGIPKNQIDMKLGKISHLNFYLSEFVSEQTEESKLLKQISELDEFLSSYQVLFQNPDPKVMRALLRELIPEWGLDYLLLKYNPKSIEDENKSSAEIIKNFISKIVSDPEFLSSSDVLVSVATSLIDKEKYSENNIDFSLYVGSLWQAIQSSDVSPEVVKEYAHFLEVGLKNGKFGPYDIFPVLADISSDSKLSKMTYPNIIYISATFMGLKWGIENIESEEILREERKKVRDATAKKLIFNPLGEYAVFYRRMIFTPEGDQSTKMIEYFSSLRSKFGDFELAKSESGAKSRGDVRSNSYYQDYVLSYWFDGKTADYPLDSVVLKKLSRLAPSNPTTAIILGNIRKKMVNGERVFFSYYSPIEKDPSYQTLMSLLYPEQELTAYADYILRFDELDYPETAEEMDKSGLQLHELQDFQEKIKTYYDYFAEQIQRVLDLKRNGFEMEFDANEYEMTTEEEESLTPWARYSFLLMRAAAGDQAAIEDLWQYQIGENQISSDINVFDEICQDLIKIGDSLLRQLDPNRFYYGGHGPTLSGESRMGMIELNHPNPDIAGIAAHLDNPQPLKEHESPVDREHPTWVAQILRGSPVAESGSGIVRSYVIEVDDSDFWGQIDAVFDQVLQDVHGDKNISVINMSFGVSGGRVSGKDFQELMASGVMESIKTKVAELTEANIPIVVSAGNSGEQVSGIGADGDIPISKNMLSQLNFLGVISPAIILVGATAKEDKKQSEDVSISHYIGHCDFLTMQPPSSKVSKFSSEGNAFIHPDIVTVGEGDILAGEFGADSDLDGTSFSAPRVARVIALMKQANPDLTVEMINAILKLTAHDLVGEVPEREGAGELVGNASLYLATILNKKVNKSDRPAIAHSLGLTETQRENLDWLSGRIKWQVYWKDGLSQSYGE